MRLLFFILLSTLSSLAFSQTVLYSENFNSEFGSFFVNTPDVNSTLGGYNQWLVNSVYAGGSFVESCVGFDVSIPNTSNQPAAITGSPQSGYMHISSTDAVNSGVSCTSFQASDGGLLCNLDENYFAKMSQDVSTLGQTGVSFSFYWLCSGSVSNYGEVYYSLNGGLTWSLQTGSYYNSPNWTLATLTNPQWDNQPQIRFGFRFVNQQSFSAADPAFAVDELRITAAGNAGNVSTQITGVGGISFCSGSSFDVNYGATGTFNSGNIFTVELSDAMGNFSAFQEIGSISSTTGGLINCTIPNGTAPGTNYRMRIRSSNPNFVSADFGVNFTVLPVPSIDFVSTSTGNNLEYSFGCSSSGFIDWQWNFGDGGLGNGVTINHTFVASGVYQVCLEATATNGCIATWCKPLIAVSTSVDELLSTTNAYPNPFTDRLFVSWEGPREYFEIFDLCGRKIVSQNVFGNSVVLDLSHFNAGVYLLRDNLGRSIYLVKED
jgi:hypothetical protein